MNHCLLGHLCWILCWSAIRELSANTILDPLRVSTRHLVPYMYEDGNGHYYDGIEFQLLQVVANLLKMNLHFQTASNVSDICYDVATNVSDICIGGIFPTENILNNSLTSVTYEIDELIWCVPKAGMMPMFLSFMFFMTPTVWFSVIFAYGYSTGLLLYLLVQFDLKFKRRNNTDWHHTTWLVALPAVIGMSPNFKPVKGTVRIFFVFVLITAFFLFQTGFTRFHEFVHKRIPWHQVSSFNEILDRDFHLIGSLEAINLLDRSKMIPQHKVELFFICGDINDCLPQLLNQERFAIGGSRQNILNSPLYSHSQVFCFEGLENIASYPVALYMRSDFHSKEKVNIIVQRLLEAGFFVKWRSDSQSKRIPQIPYTIPLQLPVSHIGAPLVFLIGCGSVISSLAFVAENIISWKMKKSCDKMKIWLYLEQFFDGERHYLKNLPERWRKQGRHSETEVQLPSLERFEIYNAQNA